MFSKIKSIVQSLYNTYIKKDKDFNNTLSNKLEISNDIIDVESYSNIDILDVLEEIESLPSPAVTQDNNSEEDSYFDDGPDDYYEEEEDPKDKYYREKRELSNKIRENPLLPYFRSYSEPHLQGSLIYKFNKEGRPFLPEDYNNVFNKYISNENFLNETKIPYLEKMWEDAKYLKNVLEPLKKMGIDYSLDLTGGSIRDYVLDRHEKIKDLDFMVSIQDEYASYHRLEQQFTKEQIDKVEIDSRDSLETIKVKLVQLCLLKHNEDIKVYNHIKDDKDNDDDDPYFEVTSSRPDEKSRIMAVYKIEQNGTHYPIDVILTDFSKPQFIDDFDFDICKASLCFINPHVHKSFPTEPNHLISRFVAPNEFWADVHNKTVTYNALGRNIYHINGAFDKHLPRIKAKYGEHKILVAEAFDNADLLKAKILTFELNEELEVKPETKPPKKMKL